MSRHRCIQAAKWAAQFLLSACASMACATPHYVAVGEPLPRFGLLKEGRHHYLRFLQIGETKLALDIWQRNVRFRDNQLVISQRLDSVGKKPSTTLIESVVEVGTFRPLSHVHSLEHAEDRSAGSFTFTAAQITGALMSADNVGTLEVVPAPEGTFNSETDLEFLQTLPWGVGYEVEINFYQPGGKVGPARYMFKVTGSEFIQVPGAIVDCWVITTNYDESGLASKLWFAKSGQIMMRQESVLADGRRLVKVLID